MGNTYALVSADFNNDGNNEIIVGNYEQSLLIYSRSGDEYFLEKELTTPFREYVRDLDVGDFNNDDKLDLVVGRESGTSKVYLS